MPHQPKIKEPIPAQANKNGDWILNCSACQFEPEPPYLCETCHWNNQLRACGVFPIKRIKYELEKDSDNFDQIDDLKAWRAARGLTQRQIASLVGANQAQISKVESGQRRMPTRWETVLLAA